MKELLGVFLKGVAMGAANVIPGVSGGTVAFITGIYERLINAIKGLDGSALKLLFRGRFRELSAKIDFPFLAALGLGIVLSILINSRFRFLRWEAGETLVQSRCGRAPDRCRYRDRSGADETCF